MTASSEPKRIPWPLCTVGQCAHSLTHSDWQSLSRVAADHPAWVDKIGRAVCRCHDYDVGVRVAVEAFPCDVVRTNLATTDPAT
jgi:hypothetical protein